MRCSCQLPLKAFHISAFTDRNDGESIAVHARLGNQTFLMRKSLLFQHHSIASSTSTSYFFFFFSPFVLSARDEHFFNLFRFHFFPNNDDDEQASKQEASGGRKSIHVTSNWQNHFESMNMKSSFFHSFTHS